MTLLRLSFPSELDLSDMDLDQMFRAAIRMRKALLQLADVIEHQEEDLRALEARCRCGATDGGAAAAPVSL